MDSRIETALIACAIVGSIAGGVGYKMMQKPQEPAIHQEAPQPPAAAAHDTEAAQEPLVRYKGGSDAELSNGARW